AVADIWNLHHFVNVEKRVKNFVRQRHRFEFAVRENFRHLPLKIRALVDSPKIVRMQKPAPQQMFAQPRGLFFVEEHLARLDNVEIREVKDARIHQIHRVWRLPISFDVRQSLDAPDKLAIRGWIIGAPTTSKPALAAFQIRALEISYGWITN